MPQHRTAGTKGRTHKSSGLPVPAGNSTADGKRPGLATVGVQGAQALAGLSRLETAWAERGRAGPLIQWLDRELDADGVPRRLPVSGWLPCLSSLAGACRSRPEAWPPALDARVEGLVRAYLRFARPGGSSVFGPADSDGGEAAAVLQFWTKRLADASLARVVRDWFRGSARGGRTSAPPPMPADTRADRPLAVLRANWSRAGDMLAMDHREQGAPCQVELMGFGQVWLGPDWHGEPAVAAVAPPRPTFWQTDSQADVAEWRFETAHGKVVRTAVLLRGRHIALLADQVEGTESESGMRIALPPRVTAAPVRDSRAIKLSLPKAPSARVLPLSLPCLPYPTDRGSFQVKDQSLVLRQRVEGQRVWMPLLVGWGPELARLSVRWRVLTVTERWRICSPDTAFACRVAWGSAESLVVYRSLGPPRRRAFLGYQTTARLLIGLFTKEGNIEPVVTVED